jgi:hypothetical protein
LARPAHGRADARYRPGPKDAPAPVPGH